MRTAVGAVRSSSSAISGATWEAFASTKSLILTDPDGVKTVYANFRRGIDAIVRDTRPAGESYTVAASVTSSTYRRIGCSDVMVAREDAQTSR